MHTQPNQVTRALVLVDLQEFDVDPTVGSLASQGPEAQAEYLDTVKSRVLPSALEALRCAREAKIEVVHVRIQSLTHDGRERSPAHKRLGIHVAPGSVHSRFLKGLEPLDDELIFNKTTSDAFHSTSLAYVLRNIGVTELYLLGVLTNECVASSARSACDLGFDVHVIPEGCAAVTKRDHQSALNTLNGRYATLISLADFRRRLGVADRLPEG